MNPGVARAYSAAASIRNQRLFLLSSGMAKALLDRDACTSIGGRVAVFCCTCTQAKGRPLRFEAVVFLACS